MRVGAEIRELAAFLLAAALFLAVGFGGVAAVQALDQHAPDRPANVPWTVQILGVEQWLDGTTWVTVRLTLPGKGRDR